MSRRRLILLGSTGSIGRCVLEVVDHLHEQGLGRFEVVALAAGSDGERLGRQAAHCSATHVALADEASTSGLSPGIEVLSGPGAATRLVQAVAREGDLVVAAIVGAAGIPSVLAAIDAGCDVALANKESLVAAGELVMTRLHASGRRLIPIDSEHSAIFQCLQGGEGGEDADEIRRIVLTSSGGALRGLSGDDLAEATIEQALDHPTWSMGPKVTIDSSTLMNKALELIEAHWLFGLPPDRIEVVLHRQSIVHGMVEFTDGSIMAQLAPPDMRGPIQHALTWPDRVEGCARRFDWAAAKDLSFEPLDEHRGRAVDLARRVVEVGGTAGAILNAANEVAVESFLAGDLSFSEIVPTVERVTDAIEPGPLETLEDVLEADAAARVEARSPRGATREVAHP